MNTFSIIILLSLIMMMMPSLGERRERPTIRPKRKKYNPVKDITGAWWSGAGRGFKKKHSTTSLIITTRRTRTRSTPTWTFPVPRHTPTSKVTTPKRTPTSTLTVPHHTPTSKVITPKCTPTSTLTVPHHTPTSKVTTPKRTPTSTLTVPHHTPTSKVTTPKRTPTSTLTVPHHTPTSKVTTPKRTPTSTLTVPHPTPTSKGTTPKRTPTSTLTVPHPTPTSKVIHRNTKTTKTTPITSEPTDTKKPKPVNQALESLAKNKVSKDNAKEVSQKLTKVFDKSPPKAMSKDDAAVAAQVLENIVSITEKLNETAGNVVGFIDSLMEMNTTTLAESGTAAKKIINVLNKLVEYIPFKEGETSLKINKTNIVIQANLVDPELFQGISFGLNSRSRRRRSTETGNAAKIPSIKLPRDIVQGTNMSSVRVGFIYYAFNKLFQANGSQEGQPSDTVLSGSVYGRNTSNLTEPVVIRLPRRHGRRTQCVFWVESVRQWSNAGCSLCVQQHSSESVECCCNHLTSFAVLFSPERGTPSTDDDIHAKILSIISYVGCIISLIGVLLTFLTYSMFRHLRKSNQQPILMNLCIAIALLLIVFVAGVNSTSNRLGCQIVAVLLHYLTLVTVLWMGIEAYNLYLQIVKVMAIYQRKFMIKAAVVGWVVPLIVVMATLAAAIFQYKHSDGEMEFYYGSEQVCILHNQLYRLVSWFAPILGIIFFNFIAFILVVYKLNSRHSTLPTEPKNAYIKNCWTALAIMCLLGITWLFGALAISDARIVFEYLFCIFNSLQGFFIFFFHCVRIKEVRSQWSFFVSGLGFSHGDSDNSQQKSRVLEKLNKESNSIHMRNFAYGHHGNDKEQPKRKITVVTMVGEDGCGHSNVAPIENRTFSNSSHYSTEF